MQNFQHGIRRIPDDMDIDTPEYQEWKDRYLDDCGLYAHHFILEELEKEEAWRRYIGWIKKKPYGEG